MGDRQELYISVSVESIVYRLPYRSFYLHLVCINGFSVFLLTKFRRILTPPLVSFFSHRSSLARSRFSARQQVLIQLSERRSDETHSQLLSQKCLDMTDLR